MSLSGAKADLDSDTDITVDDYTAEIVRSGFPAIRRHFGRVLRAALDAYLDRFAERDTADDDHRIRDAGARRRRLTASTVATFETVRDAAPTGQPYRTTLEQLWLIEEAPAWRPTRNRLRRLAAAPVHNSPTPPSRHACWAATRQRCWRDPPPPRDCRVSGFLRQVVVWFGRRRLVGGVAPPGAR